MKTIYIVRHSKAEDHAARMDFERTLTNSGREDAFAMGGLLKRKAVRVDLIIASPAARTLATAEALADSLNYAKEDIATDKKLYNAEDKTILGVLRGFSGNAESLMIVAHNPGITDFANGLLGTAITSMPTSAVIAAALRIDAWNEIRWNCGRQLFFEFPS